MGCGAKDGRVRRDTAGTGRSESGGSCDKVPETYFLSTVVRQD